LLFLSTLFLLLNSMIMLFQFWVDISVIICFFGFGISIVYLTGLVLIFLDMSYYEKKQRDFIQYGLIMLVIGFFIELLFDVGGFLTTIAVCLIIYHWVPRNHKLILYTIIILKIISAIMRIDGYQFEYEPSNTFIVFSDLYLLSFIPSFISAILFIFVYLKLYLSFKDTPIPPYPTYQQIQQRAIPQTQPKENQDVIGKICPHCNEMVEPGWKICHQCKKVLPRK